MIVFISKYFQVCEYFQANCAIFIFNMEKSRIRETPTLSTDADSRTDTNLKRLRDLSLKKK